MRIIHKVCVFCCNTFYNHCKLTLLNDSNNASLQFYMSEFSLQNLDKLHTKHLVGLCKHLATLHKCLTGLCKQLTGLHMSVTLVDAISSAISAKEKPLHQNNEFSHIANDTELQVTVLVQC